MLQEEGDYAGHAHSPGRKEESSIAPTPGRPYVPPGSQLVGSGLAAALPGGKP